jgi:hypothetical protein
MFSVPSTPRLTTFCLVGENPHMEEKGRHPSMERLFYAVKAKGITGPSELASAMNVSEQVITNWSARGISATGALQAQKAFGCDANWLLHEWGGGFEANQAIAPVDTAQAAMKDIAPEIQAVLDLLERIPPESINDAAWAASRALIGYLPRASSPAKIEQAPAVTRESTSS